MPFERIEPAQWWHGAEAAPPMPAEPGPWALTATAYGWEWRRTEPKTAPAPICGSTINNLPLLGTFGPWPRYTALPASPPAEVRAGDRVRRGHDLPRRVVSVVQGMAEFESRAGDLGPYFARQCDIGPTGAGRVWTLLPRDPTPDVPDADTAGIIREGMRTLDRLAARAGAAGSPASDAVPDRRRVGDAPGAPPRAVPEFLGVRVVRSVRCTGCARGPGCGGRHLTVPDDKPRDRRWDDAPRLDPDTGRAPLAPTAAADDVHALRAEARAWCADPARPLRSAIVADLERALSRALAELDHARGTSLPDPHPLRRPPP